MFFLLLLLSISSIISAAITVSGSLQLTDILPSPLSLPPLTRVLLSDSTTEYSSPIYTSGEFHFSNVRDGSYVLTVSCQSHGFRTLRIDVDSQDLDDPIKVHRTTRGKKWSELGIRQSYPIQLTPTIRYQHVMERPTFNPLLMLKNPLVLIGLTMAATVFGLPALTKMLDPEGIEEMERIKKERADAAKSNQGGQQAIDSPVVEKLQNFDLSGWLAGKK